MTATHARYERAAEAAFDFVYPSGYGDKMKLSWPQLVAIASGGPSPWDTFKLSRAIDLVHLYRGLARAAIEA